MRELQVRRLIEAARSGRLQRREVIRKLVGWGLSAPWASMLLIHEGIAQPRPAAAAYKPTRRGGGGVLKVLWWQGATLVNPHLAYAVKDLEASRIFYEPLAMWDDDANLVPVLAAEIPSVENGGVAADGRSVMWKLKRDVKWHDGEPFTADDCVFTWGYARDPETAAATLAVYKDLEVDKVDTHTIRITFRTPTPFWATAFVAREGMIIPKHVFGGYVGAKSREAPANLKPVGTGPYKLVDFRPGDIVRGDINVDYHMVNRPHFDSIEVKGGGDAPSAARAVLQTGEYDYAWNLLVEDEVLKRMEADGKGRVRILASGDVEFIQLNFSDPVREVDGERASAKSQHFAFNDPSVREAIALLADRRSIQEFVYGRAGSATGNLLNNPARYRSPHGRWEFNIDKANQRLDAAGWKRGADGVRAKEQRKLQFLFQTSTNAARQKVQAIVKQACQKAGIELELKAVTAAIYFSSDIANPDTYGKFWADLQMVNSTLRQPDPQRFMLQYTSWEVASKANKWQGRNVSRWTNDQYDQLFRAAESELDPLKRAALFIRMNDLLLENHVMVPLVNRRRVSGSSQDLVTWLSAWDLDLAGLPHWYRDGAKLGRR